MVMADAESFKYKRVVAKVGTSSLTDSKGCIDKQKIDRLAVQLSTLHDNGVDVILVSSGAIAAGVETLNLPKRPRSMPEKQACAAVGQSVLMKTYEECFDRYNKVVGQILLTKEDVMNRKRYLNSRNTLMTLLRMGVIPIVNENDTVAVDEINKFGENDTLSALVAGLVKADILIILSDIEGLYTKDPKRCEDAELIIEVDHISPGIVEIAGGAGSALGSGGMASKITAARIATASGIPMVICCAEDENALLDVVAGKRCGTFFKPVPRKIDGRKRWFAFTLPIRGKIIVDNGAKEALVSDGKSLLPSGIVDVEGPFENGDLVSICDMEGMEFARGLVNYSSGEVSRIRGVKSSEIESILGYKYFDEVVHRDDMVCLI